MMIPMWAIWTCGVLAIIGAFVVFALIALLNIFGKVMPTNWR